MSSVKLEIEEPLAAILRQTNQPVEQAGREGIVLGGESFAIVVQPLQIRNRVDACLLLGHRRLLGCSRGWGEGLSWLLLNEPLDWVSLLVYGLNQDRGAGAFAVINLLPLLACVQSFLSTEVCRCLPDARRIGVDELFLWRIVRCG